MRETIRHTRESKLRHPMNTCNTHNIVTRCCNPPKQIFSPDELPNVVHLTNQDNSSMRTEKPRWQIGSTCRKIDQQLTNLSIQNQAWAPKKCDSQLTGESAYPTYSTVGQGWSQGLSQANIGQAPHVEALRKEPPKGIVCQYGLSIYQGGSNFWPVQCFASYK